MAMSLCPLAHGKIIYVDEDATGANDGTSWVNAYGHLQDALADANDSAKPVEIRVAQGVYRADQGMNQTLGDRRASFHLVDRASLKGGYAGWGQPNPNARDVRRQESTLSGDIGIPNTPEDNSYHVVFSQRLNAGGTLDGFVISGGQADGSSPDDCGGGLYNFATSLVITDCTFTANSAKSKGGAIYTIGRSDDDDDSDDDIEWPHEVTRCTFSGNTAKSGGAVCNSNLGPAFTDCTFRSNSAASDGGGMCNTAHNEGGCCPTLTNCLFIGCVAGERGGAMCNLGGEEEWVVPTLTDCQFRDNKARLGGGVYSFATWFGPVFDRCRFVANRATSSGGAMYNAADDGEPCYATLTNCLLVGNIADDAGGAIHNEYAKPTLTNCTLAGNSAPSGNALSGAPYWRSRVANCILRNGGNEIIGADGSRVTAIYTSIQGGWPGEGNIDADPCFVAPGHCDPNGTLDDPNDDTWTDGDYHLLPDSPCIDAGDPNSAADPNKPESDIYGGPRFTGARIDIGADEYSKYDGGSGEPNDPYQIWSAEAMNQIGLHEEDWPQWPRTWFKLMADIDIAAFDGKQGRPAFNTIGSFTIGMFEGVFDGNGHTIAHLTLTGKDHVGLFAQLGYYAQIKDLGLLDVNVTGSGSYVGALAARVSSLKKISNCYSEGSVVGGSYVGGLVGYSGDLVNCHFTGSVSGMDRVGGLMGQNGGNVVGCHSAGSVRGRSNVGGLVGRNPASISNSYSTAQVTGEDSCVGGLVGHSDGWVTGCYSTGAVSGRFEVGGLAGVNGLDEGESGAIYNCYSTSPVDGVERVGGLVGSNSWGYIERSYSAGPVLGSLDVGGLTGYGARYYLSWGNFWDVNTSGQIASTVGTGKTTAEMQTAKTFLDAKWDFTGETANGTKDIWWIDEGKNYPRLWWEKYRGSGTAEDPYQIWTAKQMDAIGAEPNDRGKHFRLRADIDLSAFDGKDGRPAFKVIGTWSTPFTGIFDGDGHTISNLRYVSADGSCVGLFGRIEGPDAQIRNVGLIDPNVAGELEVGSLVGRLNEGAVTCCYVSGARVIGDESVGGLVGKTFQGVITNCHAEGTVEGRECVGGLLGGNDEATIVNSHATGVVKGTLGGAGGLVGANSNSMIRDCYAVCTVSGDKGIGGLAGENGWHGMITGCYAKGAVSGKVWVGGLVGLSEGDDTIVDCYSTAEAIGDQYVGGLVGEKGGTIRNCYSTGRVTARLEWGGGLVGFGWPRLVTGCFWDTETSALTTSPAGTGKTTAEMQIASTFLDAGWDFVGESEKGTEDIWAICEGVDYPHLAWQFLIGDFDADADTDFADFCILAEHWLAADGSFWCGQGCDLTNDGSVNWQDLMVFLDNWLR